MNIETVVKMYNEEGKKLDVIGKELGSSKSSVQRLLEKHGYTFDKKEKKYIKGVSNETVKNETSKTNKNETNETISTKTNEINKNVSCETMTSDKNVSGSYSIPEHLSKALKRKALEEDKKGNDIVREALEAYIENKYYKF